MLTVCKPLVLLGYVRSYNYTPTKISESLLAPAYFTLWARNELVSREHLRKSFVPKTLTFCIGIGYTVIGSGRLIGDRFISCLLTDSIASVFSRSCTQKARGEPNGCRVLFISRALCAFIPCPAFCQMRRRQSRGKADAVCLGGT